MVLASVDTATASFDIVRGCAWLLVDGCLYQDACSGTDGVYADASAILRSVPLGAIRPISLARLPINGARRATSILCRPNRAGS
jgi:hypothetical protein